MGSQGARDVSRLGLAARLMSPSMPGGWEAGARWDRASKPRGASGQFQQHGQGRGLWLPCISGDAAPDLGICRHIPGPEVSGGAWKQGRVWEHREEGLPCRAEVTLWWAVAATGRDSQVGEGQGRRNQALEEEIGSGEYTPGGRRGPGP